MARYGINEKTAAKWRGRDFIHAAPMNPKPPASTMLTPEEEAAMVTFWRYTLLPLDDCLYALQPAIPNLIRSTLHRCLQRHGISRLPQSKSEQPQKKEVQNIPGR